MRKPIMLGALVVFWASQAMAWEYQSVSSGMTLEKVTEVLAGHDKRLTLFAEKTDENPGDVYLVEPDTSILLHICNGVVNGYSDILPGSADAFVARVAAESKTRGSVPAKFVAANEGGNQLNKMVVEWNEPDGSQLSLNWSSLNGVSYTTVAVRAVCNPHAEKTASDSTASVTKTASVLPKSSTMAEAAGGSTTIAKTAAQSAPPKKAAPTLASLCAEKFRSYNPKTGLFKDFSGRMRRCDKSLVDG
jgi:hypothetical protein